MPTGLRIDSNDRIYVVDSFNREFRYITTLHCQHTQVGERNEGKLKLTLFCAVLFCAKAEAQVQPPPSERCAWHAQSQPV